MAIRAAEEQASTGMKAPCLRKAFLFRGRFVFLDTVVRLLSLHFA